MRIRYLFSITIAVLGLVLVASWLLTASTTIYAQGPPPPPPGGLEISPVMKGTCTSVYTITNLGSMAATTQHQFYNEFDQPVHSLNDTIAAGMSKAYDLANIAALFDGYFGYVLVASDQPITYILDSCPIGEWGTPELDPGASITQTFTEEGSYSVVDPKTENRGEVQVGVGITSLSISVSSVTTVTVNADGFTPQIVQVAVGDVVKWVNEDSQTHGVIGWGPVWHVFLPLVGHLPCLSPL